MADEGKHATMWAKQYNSANMKAHIATLEHCIHTMRVELHKLSQELQIITTTTPPTTPHDKVAQEVRERAQTFEEEMWAQGYREVRQIESGEWIGCMAFCYTAGLVVGLSDSGYRVRYCYATMARAVAAANAWNGHGHPPGPWIKMKGGADGNVFGPGAT